MWVSEVTHWCDVYFRLFYEHEFGYINPLFGHRNRNLYGYWLKLMLIGSLKRGHLVAILVAAISGIDGKIEFRLKLI